MISTTISLELINNVSSTMNDQAESGFLNDGLAVQQSKAIVWIEFVTKQV